ncbi:MipA/OmpV family protein [Sulfurimonas sp. SAG-AH-194-L11]|nr:MipA/OmpV family protein [Sulfurimonas sp. SAG-AH-194-L11]MDF1877425.1 MipA/OmpV family protein [Sulfurimonas sp. SAG-AH-194-L11]
MKYILLLTLLVLSLNASEAITALDTQDKNQKQKVTLGFGPYVQTQPYKGTDPLLVPSPVIFFDNGLFYVRWTRAGMYFLGNKGKEFSWGLSLTAQPRVYGYKAEDSDYLEGMDTRETTFEGGLAFSATYNDTYIETMLLTDIFARYDSWLFKTEIGDEFALGNFTFYPSIILVYESDEFVNYYYGVQTHEATQNRAEFTPGAGWQFGAQTYIEYPFTDRLSALVNLRIDRVPTSAMNSPLVDESFIYSGLVSLIYTFEY